MELGESASKVAAPPAPSGSGSGSGSDDPGAAVQARLIAVEWLDGDDTTVLSGPGIQWVSMQRDARWVDGQHVTNIDRLGRQPRIKVRFDQPGAHDFKLEITHEGDAPYEDDEKGRNARFRHTEGERGYTTDGDGTKIVSGDFEIPCSGGTRWRVEGRDTQNNRAQSQIVESNRLVYYQIIKMRDVPAASRFATFERSMENWGLEMRRLGVATMRRFANIGTTEDKDRMADEARRVYQRVCADRKEPHMVAVVFTDHLAVRASNRRFVNANVMAGPGNVTTFGIRGRGLNPPHSVRERALWMNLDDVDWFVSCKFTPTGGSPIDVAKDRCTPNDDDNNGDARSVRIDLSALPPGPGSLELRVNWVDRMRAGISFGANLIVIAARVWWRNSSSAKQNETLVHETGHKIGMVAVGGRGPNRHGNQYDDHGHRGSHCHTGVPEADDYSTFVGRARCVMFGQITGEQRFCRLCAAQVKKVDICSGWSRF